MLVATALVVLIMVLFAEVFGEAVATIRGSRGLIQNDGKARSVDAALRGDLALSTYRSPVGRDTSATITVPGFNALAVAWPGLVPLSQGDQPAPRQKGVFYISENDPLNDSDDVLHFTASITENFRDPLISNPAFAPYQGRALRGDILGAVNLNQPDLDDGVVDGASTSRAADLCYFLRGTTLYRRVQLLRDPLPSASPPFSTQPTAGPTGTGGPLLTSYPNQYRDFDFAATNITDPLGNSRLHFHGLESLDNSLGLSNTPLAVPANRFGYAPNGVPREFDVANVPFGRFTQEETSHGVFQWPGVDNGAGNNVVDSALILSPDGIVAVDSNTNGVYDSGTDVLLQGSRAGEDILMTGVEGFNIEVWDPGFREEDTNGGGWNAFDPADDRNLNGVQDTGAWVDLGNNLRWGLWTEVTPPDGPTVGPIVRNDTWGRQNSAYGPNGPTGNHVFDTWHPSLGALPPYRPLQIATTDARVVDRTLGTFNSASVGQVFFPDQATLNASIGYVAVQGGTVAEVIPEWPRVPGTLVRDRDAVWQCFDNRIGLEKMRITIRFRDPGSNLPRQVSIVHSFME